jgi:hypothetical protein
MMEEAMLPWVERPALDVDLACPEDRRFEGVPAEAFASGRRLLDAVLGEVPAAARHLADLVRRRTGDRFQAEAVALARRVGADWRDLMLANVSYDLAVARLGCSTVALPTPDGPVVARNMDWPPQDLLARASYLIRSARAGRPLFASAGWPGAIGIVTGLSARGFAVVLNAVMCAEGVGLAGYPVLLFLRCLLEDARDFDDALRMLSHQPLTAPGLFTLVGSRNEQRVVVERTPTRHALRWPQGDEPLFATNAYRLLEDGDGGPTACPRYEALGRFFARHRPDKPVTDAELLYVLSDPAVVQDITAQHVVLRPRTGAARVFVPRRLLAASAL